MVARSCTLVRAARCGSGNGFGMIDNARPLNDYSTNNELKVRFRHVQSKQVIVALGALAHESRLETFRLLVQHDPHGLPAGAIAERLKIVPSSLTFHLQQLAHAGLVTQRRVSRQLFYAADFATMNGLVAYLTENCCSGEAICNPLFEPAGTGPPTDRKKT